MNMTFCELWDHFGDYPETLTIQIDSTYFRHEIILEDPTDMEEHVSKYANCEVIDFHIYIEESAMRVVIDCNDVEEAID